MDESFDRSFYEAFAQRQSAAYSVFINDTMIEKSGSHFEYCSTIFDHARHNASAYLKNHNFDCLTHLNIGGYMLHSQTGIERLLNLLSLIYAVLILLPHVTNRTYRRYEPRSLAQ